MYWVADKSDVSGIGEVLSAVFYPAIAHDADLIISANARSVVVASVFVGSPTERYV